VSASLPRRPVLAAALLAYSAVALVWMWPMSLSPATMLPDVGDPAHLAYVLAWDAHQIVRRPWALFESNSFHPWPHSLAFGEHLVPEALAVAPVFWATGNAVLAYNASTFLGLVLSALSMLLLVRDLTGSAMGGFAAGLAYAFNGFTFTEIARVQVVHMEWWPLALLFLLRFVRNRRGSDAVGFALLMAVQGLSGTYYLVYSALVVPLWLVLLYAGWRRPGRDELRALAFGLVLAALLAAPLLWPYVGRLGESESAVSSGADLLAFVTPGAANPVFGAGASEATYAREFFGYLGLLLAMIGLWKGIRAADGEGGRAVRGFAMVAAVTLLFGLLMALGPVIRVGGVERLPGPLALMLEVLPLTSLRQTPRFAVLTKLGGAILVGIAVARLQARLPPVARTASITFLSLLLPLEHWQPPMYGSRLPAGGEVPPVYRWLEREGTSPIVELPLYAKKRFWALYLYFSTYHWRPLPIGRTSFYPPSHELLATTLSRFPDETSIEVLDRLEVRTVVVHPEVWEEHERPPRLAQLESAPRLELVRRFRGASVLPWLSESRVYHIQRSGPAAATPCQLEGELPRGAWRVTSMVASGVGRTVDGRLETAWTTRRPQAAGDRLRVSFTAPAELAAVALQSGAAFGEFPRNPVLELQDEDGAWFEPMLVDRPLERWRTIDALTKDPLEAPYVMRFGRRRAAGLRITLASEGMFTAPWTVAELRAFGECR
jgi:hypothetical protein